MFKKIELKLFDIDVTKLKGIPVLDQVTFKEYRILNRPYLMQYLSTRVKFHVTPDIINITEIESPGAGPHIDAWPVALNYYLNAGQDVTNFWEEIDESAITASNTFTLFQDAANLKLKSVATYNTGDCILLNTHSIHSIGVTADAQPRSMLRFSWKNAQYDEILNSIELL